MASILAADNVFMEQYENYQKRSCRNRFSIIDHQGLKTLSIPLQKGKNEQMPIKDVFISHETDWQQQHLKSIKAAYGKAPYFEHYFDKIEKIFESNHEKLWEFNKECYLYILFAMKINSNISLTKTYIKDYQVAVDFRKKDNMAISNPYYAQVFEDRLGFTPNASVLDLLFCIGPEAGTYLRKIL